MWNCRAFLPGRVRERKARAQEAFKLVWLSDSPRHKQSVLGDVLGRAAAGSIGSCAGEPAEDPVGRQPTATWIQTGHFIMALIRELIAPGDDRYYGDA